MKNLIALICLLFLLLGTAARAQFTTIGSTQNSDSRYLKFFGAKRETWILANGTTFSMMGDAIATIGSSGAAGPTATAGAFTLASTSTLNASYGFSGNLNYRTGRNIYFYAPLSVFSTSNQRIWYGLSDQTVATLGASDTPAGNMAAFRWSTAASDTSWKCVTQNAGTQTVASSGVAADTSPHAFEILFNDAIPNVVFKIDGTIVATATANLPASATALRFVIGGQCLDALTHQINLEAIHIESDR